MRVVIDTNVFVAAGFNPGSNSASILEAVRDGSLEMVWHEKTRAETRRLLTQIPRLSWPAVEALFRPELELSDALDLARYGGIEDADDRKYAALAELAQSPIVTNDADLLTRDHLLSVPVLTPRQFVEAHLL